MTLKDLNVGEEAKIIKLNLEEQSKRRLLNLGVYKNQKIKCIYISPFHNPKAYLVKSTLFALRNEDAKKIEVQKYD